MPKLGADMTMGKLLTWRKAVGDKIVRGEIIAEIETDKSDIEIESFVTGVVEKILIQPGEKVPTGTVLAIIREEGKPFEAEATASIASEISGPIFYPVTQPTSQPSSQLKIEDKRLRISPVAKKRAQELGIDPVTIVGSGPNGRITSEDIERVAEAKKTEQIELAINRQARMRQAVASTMARSKREIPHYYLSTSIDMSHALEWLATENQKRSIEKRLLYSVLLIKAVALALRGFSELNSTWTDNKVVPNNEIHVGVAISLHKGGLVAPALHNTDQQSLDELMKNLQDLVKRARNGLLRSTEVSDPTITITNLGEQGVETVFGIIYPPQVALVGFGKVVERPWSVAGQIVSRPIITITLSADHRVSDGHRGGQFLTAVDRLLQEPNNL
ncbi:MAG: dihydrolipoamide acetyltransferase family protein [Acidobacteriota bacterium]